MSIIFHNTMEVFITPTLPSSFPFVRMMRGSLTIQRKGYFRFYTNLEDYLSIMKSFNVVVKTTDELSSVLGVSLTEVKDNLYLVNGKLHKIHSLRNLVEVLHLNSKVISSLKDNYACYFDLFKDYSLKGKLSSLIEQPKTKVTRSKVVDFEGRVFPSKAQMLSFYGVPKSTFDSRIERGYSLKDALTLPKLKNADKIECVDHFGRVFPSKRAMANFYNVGVSTLNSRLKSGLSVRDALTLEVSNKSVRGIECTDLQGRLFPSLKNMANHYGVNSVSLSYWMKKGYTPAEALGKLLKET